MLELGWGQRCTALGMGTSRAGGGLALAAGEELRGSFQASKAESSA